MEALKLFENKLLNFLTNAVSYVYVLINAAQLKMLQNLFSNKIQD